MSVRHPIADTRADIAGGRLGHKAIFLVAKSTLMELPAYVYGRRLGYQRATGLTQSNYLWLSRSGEKDAGRHIVSPPYQKISIGLREALQGGIDQLA
jgi:hypothetical protein